MERLNSALYTVSQGEVVTVTVQAVKVANLDSYTVDSVVQTPVSNDPRTYAFTVSKPSGMNVRTAVSFFFPDEAPTTRSIACSSQAIRAAEFSTARPSAKRTTSRTSASRSGLIDDNRRRGACGASRLGRGPKERST